MKTQFGANHFRIFYVPKMSINRNIVFLLQEKETQEQKDTVKIHNWSVS